MNSPKRTDAESHVAPGIAIAPDANAVAEFLRRHWGMPLRTTADVDPLPPSSDPVEVVRIALDSGDVRLVRALPCWVSLLANLPTVPEGSRWSDEDRRRLAYICELAAALRCLRESSVTPEDPDRPASVAGIEPKGWRRRIPLCPFEGRETASSIFGERWGILEPMAFPEYVAFQEQYLRTSEDSHGGQSQ